MSTIQQMLDRANAAKNGIAYEMPKIVLRNKEKIMDLNKLEQLHKNTNSKGDAIGNYTRATEAITTAQAQQGKNVRIKFAGEPFDFLQTGDFFRQFDLDFGAGELDLFSTDPKTPKLEAKYAHIFGLTEANQFKLNYEIIKPELAAFIKRTLDG